MAGFGISRQAMREVLERQIEIAGAGGHGAEKLLRGLESKPATADQSKKRKPKHNGRPQKLTGLIAREICQSKESASELAEQFGVSERTIFSVRSGQTWTRETDGFRLN